MENDHSLFIPRGTNTYPANADSLGLEPETIIREAINKKPDYKSKKEAPMDNLEAMVNAQTITEMMDDNLQI